MSDTGGEWLDYAAYREGAPHTVVGTLRVRPQLYSPQLDNRRDVLVYLPPSHATGERAYPVLYLQDGQNLFDADTAFGGQEWQVDETLEALSAEGLEALVVGLPHMGPERIAEYNPFAARGGRGQAYLSFVMETVKPLIDASFHTRPERESTYLGGSSMGGLISFYGFLQRPDSVGGVLAMSPAFWYGGRALAEYVSQHGWRPGRVYLDRGTTERGGAARMAKRLIALGYAPETQLRYVEEEGGQHSERAWARRLPEALRFLLRP
ncbi:MAG: alpha/beta hydrolase [Anaerolineales bacterium]|nr:alpha/beta hydrolase [Anaerolineales bacterium]